ncbi:hypothetical protein C7I36_12440 [Zobellella taiwanensis]|uniref:Toxin-antitoxin system antitoxin subunit n=1 Tax=Zobellella taiwanensis TaxID=347535 RepID=A0A2P7QQ13_9GAMM|nr:Cthe_2314 family HEPN domain-containing protein [Zobellella taiwanensis]PSJ40069.1 hypothetical protein C7I36_12440 [Zobellella taiwanensis]
MNSTVFQGIQDICHTHAERLSWAMHTLADKQPFTPATLQQLDAVDLAVMDQFIVRFSKLQDAMGARLMPAILELTKEQGSLSTFIDKLNRLEKIGAINSAEQWLQLREMRNQFAHDYPQDSEIQAELLNAAFGMAEQMLDILKQLNDFAKNYLP